MEPQSYKSYSERFAQWCFAQPWFPEERDRAAQEFMAEGFDPRTLMDGHEETVDILFHQWVMFDRPTAHANTTPLERFIAQETQPESEERVVYEQFRKSWLSGFIIQQLRRGEGFVLQDIVTGKEYDVREHRGTFDVAVGGLLFGRILQFRDHYVLAAGYGYWQPDAAQSLTYRFARSRQRGKQFDRLTAPALAQMFLMRPPETPADARAMTTTALDDLLRTLGAKRWTATEIITIMERVTDPTDVISRVLQEVAPKHHRHTEELTQALIDVWNAMRALQTDGSAVEPGPIEHAILGDMHQVIARRAKGARVVDDAAYRAFAQQCMGEYLDTAQRELDGKTPREAIRAERKALGNPHPEPSLTFTAIRTEPEHMTTFRKQFADALAAYERGAYTKALRIYKAMLAAGADREPESWRIYGNAGGCAFALGKLHLAEQYLHHALARNPRYRIAQNNLKLIQEVRTRRETKRPPKQTK